MPKKPPKETTRIQEETDWTSIWDRELDQLSPADTGNTAAVTTPAAAKASQASADTAKK